MKTMKVVGTLVLAALLTAGCTSPGTTSVTFSLTDAPVDTSQIAHIYAQFGGLSINESASASAPESSWISVPIDTTKVYDLLALSGGLSDLLGTVPLDAGTQINQIRFTSPLLTVVETADPTTELPCTLNSSSLKIVKAFAIPLTGSLGLTVDFDARKSLVTSATGYKMTPVLRAVVDNEAGKILGSFATAGVTNPASDSYMVYAYKTGTYTSAEALPNAEGTYFANAITAALPKSDGVGGYTYTLAFLEAGTYDLVVFDTTAATVADATSYVGVSVLSAKETTLDINLP